MNPSIDELRKEVARTMRRLVRHGLTTTTGGNVSARTDQGVICITPSQVDKEFITPQQVGIVHEDGVELAPGLKLSMETAMHQAIYQRRSEVLAIVHAHPAWATAHTLTGTGSLRTDLIAETWALLGSPVWVPYALMGTQELADRLGECIGSGNVMMLENHGIITVGLNLWQAFSRLEAVEEAAKISVISALIGGATGLNAEHKLAIDVLMGR